MKKEKRCKHCDFGPDKCKQEWCETNKKEIVEELVWVFGASALGIISVLLISRFILFNVV